MRALVLVVLLAPAAAAGCGGSTPAATPEGAPAPASPASSAPSSAGSSAAGDAAVPKLAVRFLEPGAQKLEPIVCGRVAIVAGQGPAKAGGEALAQGDILFVEHPQALDVDVPATSKTVVAVETFPCAARARPAERRRIIRATEARDLRWAAPSGGTMSAHLDLGKDVSPDFYVGRLEGTAGVPEHVHDSSTEILVALEAAGTFTVDGKEQRLGPGQIVTVPKGTKHSWKPDPGSKLVAVQLYDPPGPEQRFIALADAGAPQSK